MSSGNPSANAGNSGNRSGKNSQGNRGQQTSGNRQSAGRQSVGQPESERREIGRQQNSGQSSDSQSLWASNCDNVGSTERIVSAGLGGLLVASGIVRGRLPGLLLTAVGASLLYRGLSGYCALYQQLGMSTCELDEQSSESHSHSGQSSGLSRGPLAGMMPHHDAIKGIKIEESFTIDRSAHELYEVWTKWEELPQLLPHIKSIETIGDKKTRWTAVAPMGVKLTWEAEIIKQEADRMVSWKSTSGDVATAGSVHFESRGDNKTEMKVSMQYDPPGGKALAAVAEFFNMGLDKRVREDLKQFKDRLESRSKQPTK